jgi:2-phospho-L-lactate transferase/gluconeogenesis factor (CofD/UPF0052 family)
LRPHPNRPPRTSVAVFCGGRGSSSIVRELLRRPEVDLTLLVNAYDDGLSTGTLRSLVPGMLGPADFRKNLALLLEPTPLAPLGAVMQHRLACGARPSAVGELLAAEIAGASGALSQATRLDGAATPEQAGSAARVEAALAGYAAAFAGHVDPSGDLDDCALGNVVFAGAYLRHGHCFNRALAELTALLGLPARLLNVDTGENRVLVALKADGELLEREAAIVAPQSAVPILDFHLLAAPLSDAQRRRLDGLAVDEKRAALAALASPASISPEADDALRRADLVLYGPGTQFSSLLPSYAVRGVSDAVAAGASERVLIVNLREDNDIRGLSAPDIVARALATLGDPLNDRRLVTHVFCDRDAGEQPGGLTRDTGERCPHAAWIEGAFEDLAAPGWHHGPRVVDAALGVLESAREGAGRRPAAGGNG